MKQADEVVVAFGARKGGTNARLKPKSASNDGAISTAKPGSQLARLAIRRCWLSSWGSSAKDRLIGWHGDLPEILVVPLTEPLVQYGESSRNHPQRPDHRLRAAFLDAMQIGGWCMACASRGVRCHGCCTTSHSSWM